MSYRATADQPLHASSSIVAKLRVGLATVAVEGRPNDKSKELLKTAALTLPLMTIAKAQEVAKKSKACRR